MQIRDQIVLVTGEIARGLGLAITQLLIQEGARVVVNYHSSKTKLKLCKISILIRSLPVRQM